MESLNAIIECSANQAALWRDSLRLWLQWNEAHDALTAAMFESRQDAARQSELIEQMDQLDQLRWRAVELAQELLAGETAT